MARIHGRTPCDWALNISYPDPGFLHSLVSNSFLPPRITLSLRLTYDEANQLLDSPAWRNRGCPSWTHRSNGAIDIEDIEVTLAEADAIRHGASPLEVLHGEQPWTEGYRVTVVPDPLLGGKT